MRELNYSSTSGIPGFPAAITEEAIFPLTYAFSKPGAAAVWFILGPLFHSVHLHTCSVHCHTHFRYYGLVIQVKIGERETPHPSVALLQRTALVIQAYGGMNASLT